MLFNENRIIQDNTQTSSNSTTSDTTTTEKSQNSLIFIIVFSAPAGIALIFFVILMIIRKCKKPKSSEIKISPTKSKEHSKVKIVTKDTFKEQNNNLDKTNLNNNKTTSRIGLIQDVGKENFEKKNSKIISNENDLPLKKIQTKLFSNAINKINEEGKVENQQENKKSPLKNFWKENATNLQDNDEKLNKLVKLRSFIYRKTSNPSDSTNSFSFSKFSFGGDSSHSQVETFNKTKQYLAVKLSNIDNVNKASEEDNNSEFRQTEQSKDNENYQFDQLNLFRMKGIINEYQNTEKAGEDLRNSSKIESIAESILEENDEQENEKNKVVKENDNIFGGKENFFDDNREEFYKDEYNQSA